ncbi:glycosyltransferase family 2 protein [Gammaproteobacteria bacterium]|nr:glycosyltransferase family 2 protein [Gammaproteobacteria bacterium]
MDISVILPTKDLEHSAASVLLALSHQTLKPAEIIIIDSSKSQKIKALAKEFSQKLNIVYFFSSSGLYPGEARNKGIELAKYEAIAFIDSKTIPSKTWLEKSANQLVNGNYDVIFGSTLYKANTKLQKIFQASIYGIKPVVTTPGSLLSKTVMKKIGNFVEDVRASEDQEWKNRIYEKNILYGIPTKPNLEYSSISKSLYVELKRNFIYQLHTAKTDAQTNAKIFIFGIFITLLTLLAPSWNLLIGWKASFLYIPNVTKIYLSLMIIIFGILLVFYQKKIKQVLLRFIIVAIGIATFYIVYRWNGQISKSIDFIIYFPHITKIYILSLLLSGFIYRGLISPINKGTEIKLLFPFWWLKIGFICLMVDLIKLPGYIFGAVTALYRMIISAIKV